MWPWVIMQFKCTTFQNAFFFSLDKIKNIEYSKRLMLHGPDPTAWYQLIFIIASLWCPILAYFFSKWNVDFHTQIILLSTRWYRLRPSRPEAPLLHGPVWAGAPEASGDQPPAVCRPVLQGRQPHPEERLCQAAAGPRRRHPGAGSAQPLRHRPGEAGHREGPSKKASANGEGDFYWFFSINLSSLLKSLLK